MNTFTINKLDEKVTPDATIRDIQNGWAYMDSLMKQTILEQVAHQNKKAAQSVLTEE